MGGEKSPIIRVGLVYKDALGSGGYPRDVRWLASSLAAHGVSVTLFTGPGAVTEGLESAVRVELLKRMDRDSVDLFHFFGIFIPGQLWHLMRVMGKPVVISPMGHLMPYHLKRGMLKKKVYLRAIRPLISKVRGFHVFSDQEIEGIREYVCERAFTFKAGLGIFPPQEKLVQVGETNWKQNKNLELLFFGRNDIYQKGLDLLLEGFALAMREGINARLTIARQPWMSSEKFIRSFIETHNLQANIRLLGAVDEKTKHHLLASADYLLYLSRWDGPPRPIREAIAVGTPVIVSPETNMGGLVKEFEAGLEVHLKPENVAMAISRISADRELWKRHKDGVIRLREHLDWRRVAQDYIRGYEQVLALSS